MSELNSILHSKRANMYYLQRCRVLVNGGRVEYVTEEGPRSLYWNIPIANTTTILLGPGTSITQAAMRLLASAGVLVGFCGSGGTPLFSSNEVDVEVSWLTPQSEYRPTKYLQNWVQFWFDPDARLEAAKKFQRLRLNRVLETWSKYRPFVSFHNNPSLSALIENVRGQVEKASDTLSLMTAEARATKVLYRLASEITEYGDFKRSKRGTGLDSANRFLDHGNYLAYGMAATATWVLGIPHGLAVMHGKTRRGGLVFDVADLVKDSIVLPQAFISAVRGDNEQRFRAACLDNLNRTEALDFMIDSVKQVAEELGHVESPTSITM